LPHSALASPDVVSIILYGKFHVLSIALYESPDEPTGGVCTAATVVQWRIIPTAPLCPMRSLPCPAPAIRSASPRPSIRPSKNESSRPGPRLRSWSARPWQPISPPPRRQARRHPLTAPTSLGTSRRGLRR